MNFITTAVPLWVSLLFLVCFISPIFLLANATQQAATNANLTLKKIKQLTVGVTLFLVGYYIYVALMSQTGIFQENSLPPKILLFTSVPLLIFYFFLFFASKLFWKLLMASKLSTLVRLHYFRFVGIFFIIVWYYKTLPTYFAWSAGLGDIFAAATAIWVVQLINNKHKHYKRITLFWNIIGFWDIINVVITALIVTKQSIETGSQGVQEMANFPFALIPAFAPATIIFLHIAIFKKLKMEKH
jgi:hypothetical protein